MAERINCDVVAKLVRKDKTSLVRYVCCSDGKCFSVYRGELGRYSFRNATVGVNGNLYPKKGTCKSVLYFLVEDWFEEGMSRCDFEGRLKGVCVR